MRIAILTDGYPSEKDFSSGVGTYFHSMARGFIKLGHEVKVFSPSYREGETEYEGVAVRQIFIDRDSLEKWERIARWKLNLSIRFIYQSWKIRNVFLKEHKRTPFDIVQTTSSKASGLMLSLFRKTPIATFAAYHPGACRQADGLQLTFDQKISEWLQIKTIRQSNGVFVPSQWGLDLFKSEYGIQSELIRMPYIPDDVAPDESEFENKVGREPYLLYFGQLNGIKGVDLLALAFAQIAEKEPGMRLVMVGRDLGYEDGCSMQQFFTDTLGKHAQKVTYLEHVPHNQLYPIIKNARGVVLPSRADNLPNTMLESMDLGKVVLGARGASYDEMITDRESGLLFDKENVEELAKKMLKLWNLPEEERKQIGENARAIISQLSPEKSIPKFIAYYEKLKSRF